MQRSPQTTIGYGGGRGLIVFWLINLAALLLTRDASLLLHEWSHSTVAWLYGLKEGPFGIHYGGWSLMDVYAVDSGNFYARLFDSGQNSTAALIAIAGPNTNFILTLVCSWLLARRRATRPGWPHVILFWFLLNNLGQVYCYVPMRLFSQSGDIAYFLRGASLSPWVLGLPVVAVLVWVISLLFGRTLPWLLDGLGVHGKGLRYAVYVLSLLVLFGWYGMAPLMYYGLHDIRSIAFPVSLALGLAAFFVFRGRLSESPEPNVEL